MKESRNVQRMWGWVSVLIFTGSLLLLTSGCKNEITPSLYDPNYTAKPAPTISSISPTSGLAGLTTFTITGTNFSATKEENTVLFDAVTAQVVSASATQLTVKAPNLPKDSIKVTVTVFGADKFSNILLCKLEAAVAEFGGLQPYEEPKGITCDAEGNLYVSMIKNSLGDGIKRITPAGVKTDWAPAGGVLLWSALRIGPGGVLYAARTQRAIFTISQNSSAVPWVQIIGSSLYDLDFDKQGNLWTGGNNVFVYRIKPDKSVKSFPFVGNVRSVRVFNDYLYLGGKVDSIERVYRFKIISSDSLGTAEKYFDLSAVPGYGANGPGVYAITFSRDGDMYVGTNGSDAILLVHPGGSYEPLYPGLLKPQSLVFAWGKGTDLYVSRSGDVASHTIIKINTLKNSAPYYGRGDQ